jgi:hypothetical protein
VIPDYGRRHTRIGWWSLLVFLGLGSVLEGMHGLKLDLYLDVSNETRRLMWTLSHAHGTLIAVLHLVFAWFATTHASWSEASRRVASPCLTAAGILLPAGFFLGGAVVYGGDPGIGVVLVPVGAACLLVAVFLTARSTSTFSSAGGSDAS